MYIYIYIMCMYYGVVQGLASPFWRCIAKKGEEGEDTGLCLVPPPPWCSFRAAIVVFTIFVALEAWAVQVLPGL